MWYFLTFKDEGSDKDFELYYSNQDGKMVHESSENCVYHDGEFYIYHNAGPYLMLSYLVDNFATRIFHMAGMADDEHWKNPYKKAGYKLLKKELDFIILKYGEKIIKIEAVIDVTRRENESFESMLKQRRKSYQKAEQEYYTGMIKQW